MKEKRIVSILYADIAGFTTLSQKLGAEELAEVINEIFNLIDCVLNNYSGTIIRHEGDRVMAIFGFPCSTGNDSYYALCAALKIKEMFKNSPYGLGIHIGVGSGDVMIVDNELFGPVIQETSRLEEIAGEDEILVSESTYKMNQDKFVWEISDSRIKLLDQNKLPVRYRKPLLGRKTELETLINFLKSGINIIAISGIKGTGKTHFIYEGLRKTGLERESEIYEATFFSNNLLIPYSIFIDLAKQIIPNFQLEQYVELSDESYRLKIFGQITEVFYKQAKIKPIIIVLQNFGSIDSDSLEFLKYFINNLSENIKLFLELDTDSREMLDQLKDIKEIKEICLSGLDQNTVKKIICSFLSGLNIDDKLVEDLCEFSQGNPLHAEELCRLIRNTPDVVEKLKGVLTSYRFRELASGIIDDIPSEFKDNFFYISILGNGCDKAVLQHFVPNIDSFLNWAQERGILYEEGQKCWFKSPILQNELCARLTRDRRLEIHLRIAETLESSFAIPENFGTIAYHYEQAGSKQKSLNFTLKWAEYLKSMHSTSRAVETYYHAYELVGNEDVEKKFKIVSELVNLYNLMGKREMEAKMIDEMERLARDYRNEEWLCWSKISRAVYFKALGEYRKAKEIIEGISNRLESCKILELLGLVYYELGELNRAVLVFNKGISRARFEKDQSFEALFLQHLGLVYWKKGDKELALMNYQKAKAIYESLHNDMDIASVYANIASVYFYLNKFTNAAELYKKALDVAERIEDQLFQAQLSSNLGSIYFTMGEYEKALEYFQKALVIDKQIMNRKGEAVRYNNIANIYAEIGDYEKALKYFKQALKIDKRIENKSGIIIRYGNIAGCMFQMGKMGEAVEFLQRAISMSEEMQLKEYLAYYYNEYGAYLFHSNRLSLAQNYMEKALELSIKVNNPSYEINALSNLALVFLKKMDLPRALKYSTQAINQLSNIKTIEGNKTQIYYNHYKVLLANQNAQDAEKYLEMSYREIMERAEKIVKKGFRIKYLNKEFNNSVVEEWKKKRKQN